jgi:hypothetical protein
LDIKRGHQLSAKRTQVLDHRVNPVRFVAGIMEAAR